jgi:hypothetical protein
MELCAIKIACNPSRIFAYMAKKLQFIIIILLNFNGRSLVFLTLLMHFLSNGNSRIHEVELLR